LSCCTTDSGLQRVERFRLGEFTVVFRCHFLIQCSMRPGWPQVWVKKIQGLFKDIQVRFQDLFQRRFTAMWAY